MGSSTVEPLVVRDIRATENGAGVRLSARIGTLEADPSTVWFQYPSNLAPLIAANADAFFPAALLRAMRDGRRLLIESDVSSALLAASSRIMGYYMQVRAAGRPLFHPVEITADSVPRRDRGRRAGAFFSCGVDSFYTLLGNVARYPDGDSRSIRDLVLVQGFDITLEQQGFFETVREQAELVGEALGRPLLPVRTNVRDILGGMDWAHHAVGPAMTSVGLGLGGHFHTLYLSSARAFTNLRPIATGCHPGLDPLWSTETLEFVHAGAEASKDDKIAVIASSPVALRVLRVCWENRDGAYNCGRCEKCLRTMVLLDLNGVLDQTGRFPHRIDAGALAALDLTVGGWAWLDILARVKRAGGRLELADAIEAGLARVTWETSRWGRLDAWATLALSRIGLRLDWIRGLDRALLCGLGTRLYRAARLSSARTQIHRLR